MAFTSIDWQDGEVITEQKLNAMHGNAVHLYDEAGTRLLVAGHVNMGNDVVAINETVIMPDTDAQPFLGDYSISGLEDGKVHTIQFGFTSIFRFLKTPDINYITVWIVADAVRHNATVIGHRDPKGWTA